MAATKSVAAVNADRGTTACAAALAVAMSRPFATSTTAALDARSGHQVMELLRSVAVRPGRVVIVVSHDQRVFGFADRIAEMDDGVVIRVEDRVPGPNAYPSAHP